MILKHINMANQANVNPVFQLIGVELHQLTIHKPAPGTPAPAVFNFDVNTMANVDKGQKVVINTVTIKIKGDSKADELGSIACACIFSVANFDEVVTMKSEIEAEISDSFSETLNSITISTARGMMASELKGTFLHFAILPIIDIKNLKKNMPQALAG